MSEIEMVISIREYNALLSKIDAAVKKAEDQKRWNENLLRICKEKANADRGITPKQTRSGYIVRSSQERHDRYIFTKSDEQRACERYTDGCFRSIEAYAKCSEEWRQRKQRIGAVGTILCLDIWETQIQTPYRVNMDGDLVLKQLEEDLKADREGGSLLSRIGIDVWDTDSDIFCVKADQEYDNLNVLYQITLRSNYDSKYWLINIRHTKALENVPDDMLPEWKRAGR